MTTIRPPGIHSPENTHTEHSPHRLDKAADRVVKIIALACLAMAASLIWMAVDTSSPSALIPAGVFVVALFLSLLMWVSGSHFKRWQRVAFSAGPMYAALILYSALVEHMGLPMAAGLLIATFIISSWSLEDRLADSAITVGIISAMMCSLASLYPPFAQIENPVLVLFGYINFGLMVVLYAALLFRHSIKATLRTKIILSVLVILLLPAVLISVFDNATMRTALQNETNQSLMNTASMLATKVDEFITTNRASIAIEAEMQIYSNYLILDPRLRPNSAEAKELMIALDSFKASLKPKERAFLVSYALLDRLGTNVFSSDPVEVGNKERQTSYFLEPNRNGRAYASEIEFSPFDDKPYIYFSQIVKGANQDLLGVLRARFDANILQSYANEFSGSLGQNSYPLLLDENHIRLADARTPAFQWKAISPLPDETMKRLMSSLRLPGSILPGDFVAANAELNNYLADTNETPFFTVQFQDDEIPASVAVVQTTNRPWTVVYAQSQDVLLTAMDSQTERATLVATLVAGVVALLATLVSRLVTDPILKLVKTAEEISAGNLNAKATVVSDDELGLLAGTFNAMTGQIHELIGGLEQRVNERTQKLAQQNDALRFRARQLETIAAVARSATSSQDLEELLSSVTRLVSDNFNFYHVGIFLIDERGEYAILRAANSEGGQRMLARKHQLKVGQVGIVGFVTEKGRARIATDVGQDAVYFNNPDLPLTRSEMALPLKNGEQITGALDVQSTEPNAFTQDDIQLFGILADQVAIAIHNNLLYTRTAAALQDAERVHQRYLRQAWQHEQDQYRHWSYRFDGEETRPYQVETAGEILASIQSGQPEASKNGVSALAVPVKIRGETIGVIRLKEADLDRDWDDQETELVQSIADQMGVALENARLFSQTTRRAVRERSLMEITSKIRATNNPQEMMQIASEEIKKVLKASRAQIVIQHTGQNNEPSSQDLAESTARTEEAHDDHDCRRE